MEFIARDYEMELSAPACEPGAEYWNATAHFQGDLSDVFPYLNASWKDVVYNPGARQVTWRYGDRAVAIKPNEITISNLPDRDTAAIEMERIIAEINNVWMDREKITPVHEPRKRLVAMEIYKLLPKVNDCKECGASSCFVFAGKVAVGQADIHDCKPLFDDPQYAAQRDQLLAMVEGAV
jgi:ArsR family metal-binding transcriptional regulator